MSDKDRKQAQKSTADQEDVAVEDVTSAKGEEITDRIDDILEEIDSVLEENAEEFVKNYVQKGGQ